MSKKHNTSDGNGALAIAILAIAALPIVGIYLLTKKDPTKKLIGVVILILFVVVMVYVKSR